METSFGKKIFEPNANKELPAKAMIYRSTEGLREVYRRMQAAKSAGTSNLLFKKLQHVS